MSDDEKSGSKKLSYKEKKKLVAKIASPLAGKSLTKKALKLVSKSTLHARGEGTLGMRREKSRCDTRRGGLRTESHHCDCACGGGAGSRQEEAGDSPRCEGGDQGSAERREGVCLLWRRNGKRHSPVRQALIGKLRCGAGVSR